MVCSNDGQVAEGEKRFTDPAMSARCEQYVPDRAGGKLIPPVLPCTMHEV